LLHSVYVPRLLLFVSATKKGPRKGGPSLGRALNPTLLLN